MSGPDFSDGCMIALYPPPDLAHTLSVPDALGSDELHVTVAYLGHATDVDHATLLTIGKELATRPPLKVTISGHARFTGGDRDVAVALVDSADLEQLRRDAVDRIAEQGISIPREHGYTPHLTQAYIPPDAQAPVERIPATAVAFGALSIVHGTDRTDFPFATHPIEAYAREAFAAGWAASRGPMTDRVKTACTAAVQLAVEHAEDPHVLEVTLDLGHLEGMWERLFQRREQLITQHGDTLAGLWRAALAGILANVIRNLRHNDSREAATEAAAEVLASLPNRPDWVPLRQAMRDALAAGRAEGSASAATINADRRQAEPPGWDAEFAAALTALAARHVLWGDADSWLERLLKRAAAALGAVFASVGDSTDGELGDLVDQATGKAVGFTTDWAITSAAGAGALAWYQQQDATLIEWITAGDGAVCFTCDTNEADGPYPPTDFPDLPAHPGCRCIPSATT